MTRQPIKQYKQHQAAGHHAATLLLLTIHILAYTLHSNYLMHSYTVIHIARYSMVGAGTGQKHCYRYGAQKIFYVVIDFENCVTCGQLVQHQWYWRSG